METLCILWTGGVSAGYGTVYREGRSLRAHQAVWLDAGREIPPGHDVHHVCENRLCCNIEHLQLLTHSEHARIHALARGPRSHCKRGHALSEENSYVSGNGRECLTCKRARRKRQYAAFRRALAPETEA